MRLKFAISFVESTYSIIGFLALAGIIGSFFVLKGTTLVITIIALLAVLVAIFFLKLKLINFYLKRCKYPYEFLSVLDQLKLMEDLQITWSPDGAGNSNHLTKEFLDDNNLVTEIGKVKSNSFVLITLPFASLAALGYVGYMDAFPQKSVLMVLLALSLIFGFYVLARARNRSYDRQPVLIFNEKALVFEDRKIAWNQIDSWKVKDGRGESERYILIYFNEAGNALQEIKVPLHELNIDRIDCLLLLTHFKSKYGSGENSAEMG